ncbi:MAG TPA: PadR family transcriptional regulator [Thermoanaerobaculia bacterium]|jgi:PadR family transcriptional regulator, regulatory protein PadR|nr:PadR family transcriptional regulator [Thermoanaerobaculia bacterium]
MSKQPLPLLQGTLDALILKTLSRGPRHGYAIARWLEDATEDALQIEEGSLYPALYRMERRGWIEAEWGISELNRKAKFYRLTPAGHSQLAAETAQWESFTAAVAKVLLPAT